MKIAINQSMKYYPTSYTVDLKNSQSGRAIASIYLPPAEIENKDISAGINTITSYLQKHIDAISDTNCESYQYNTDDLKPLYRMVLERAGNEDELNSTLLALPTRYFGGDDIQAINNLELSRQKPVIEGTKNER